LRDNLLTATGATGANELLHLFYTDAYSRDRVAAMADLVGEAARGGDGVALEILHQTGQELAEFAGAVRRQIFGNDERPPAAGVGGVFKDGYVRERFRSLVETAHGLRFTSPRYSPAGGALLEAYRLAGHPVEALLIETK
jgi:N-acetylglucosamine kinase-like BadF-type ATPase